MVFFKQIIFPPKKEKKTYTFWFEGKKGERVNLFAICPMCKHEYLFLGFLNETHARLVLNQDISIYIEYARRHCPKCYPYSTINLSDNLIFNLSRL